MLFKHNIYYIFLFSYDFMFLYLFLYLQVRQLSVGWWQRGADWPMLCPARTDRSWWGNVSRWSS